MAGGLARAQAEIAQVGQLLLSPSPEALDQCTPLLHAAITEMNSHRLELDRRAPARLEFEQALQVRQSLQHVRLLLEGAARYYRNWMKRRDAMLGGYAPDGQPAAASTRGRLTMEG